MATRYAFAAAMRVAAVDLLKDYADTVTTPVPLTLQVYRARPASVMAPCAFVDRVRETVDYSAASYLRRRTVTAEVLVLWGLFDSGSAVDQRDRFVDGFIDWVSDNPNAAGGNQTIELVSIVDDPTYVPDWLRAQDQKTYYGTRFALEGFTGG